MDRGLVIRGAAAAFVATAVLAIAVQEWSGLLPLGLFNDGAETFRALSLALLALGVAALGVFAIEWRRGAPLAIGRQLRGLLVSLLMLEGIVTAIDVGLDSRSALEKVAFGGPYTERRSATGEWLTLKKPHSGSPYGFRSVTPAPLRAEQTRILFLGDSYTEGSGSSPDCNYPEVAARQASERLGRPVEAMNAGLAGYGPRDAARLLRHFDAEGSEFDAIVLGLFLENDFRDNLPGTERRVVAGIIDRFPAADWLRWFHPLNSRSFRYALFFRRTSTFLRPGHGLVFREERECDLTPVPVGRPEPSLVRDLLRKLERNHAADAPVALDEVALGLEEIGAIAAAREVPFVVAVFPDRLLVDAAFRQAAGSPPLPEASPVLAFVASRGERIVDTSAPLAETPGAYRAEDSHLSDLGNVVVGTLVGEALAAELGAASETD